MIDKILHTKWWWLVLLAAAAGIILLSDRLDIRTDLTAEKRYTITPPTQKLLAGLAKPVEIFVLLKGENLPSGFIKLAKTTEDFLANGRSYSNGNLSYSFVTPDEFLQDSLRFPLNDTAKAAWLKSSAVKQNEINSSGTRAVFNYPVALVSDGEQFATVNLLQGQGNKGFLNPEAAVLQLETINKAEAQMEYQFASAIQSITNSYVPIVAYATGHGQPVGANTYDLSQTLQSKFRFFLLNLKEQPFISDSIKALMIVKPTEPFGEAEKLKIDQYIMRGGKVLFLLDALNADMDSLLASGRDFTAYSRDLRLEDLLFRYGARINNDLVQDRQCDLLPQAVGMVGDQPQIEVLPWPYFPLLYSSSNHPVGKNLDAVVMQFPNSVDTVKADGVQKEILLATSNTSRLTGAPAIVTVEVLKQMENASAWKQRDIPLAVLLQGRFRSLFTNRLPGAVADSLAQMGRPFLSEGQKPGQVLVTGDGDWVLNGMSRQGPLAMGTNPYTEYQFANKDFLLNTLDYMTDESGIMASRSKDFTLRLLDPRQLEENKTYWQWFNIGLPLALLMLAGFIFIMLRKKRYT